MFEVILIGAEGETWPYEAVGLTCFEPAAGCVAERVLAERTRCEVLAMTQAAFDRLSSELANAVEETAWPELAIVPAVDDVRGATLVVDDLRRTLAARHPLHAA